MSQPKYKNPPPVFMLEMIDQGYAIARELAAYGIPIVGFLPQGPCIESHSRIASKICRFPERDEERVALMLRLKGEFAPHKPVLILSSEAHIPFLFRNRKVLETHFAFELPEEGKIQTMLEKDLFSAFARKHQILIPASLELSNKQPITAETFEGQPFPMVVKPKIRDHNWKRTYKSQKAFLARSPTEAFSLCRRLLKTADRLVAQEWIPGPDRNIHFCLTYLCRDGEALDTVCGIKLQQHPPLFGNTAAAITQEVDEVTQETLRLLRAAEVCGFCSVEFKQHAHNGRFYVIEPTVGRMNRQELFSMLGQHRLVLAAYCRLSGLPMPASPGTSKPFIYVEEGLDIKSSLDYQHYGAMNWKEWFSGLTSRQIRPMFISSKDPLVSLLTLAGVLKHLGYYLFKGRTRHFYEDPTLRELIHLNQNN